MTLETEIKSFVDLQVDLGARQVLLSGRPVHLTRTEFDLLAVFVNSPRRAFSRAQLIEMVWGGNWFGETHMVSVHISNLRRKIGDAERVPPLIHTLHGVGYRFDGQPQTVATPALDGQPVPTPALDGQQVPAAAALMTPPTGQPQRSGPLTR